MQKLASVADGLLAFLQDGLDMVGKDGVDAGEAKLTCLADSAVLLADMAGVSGHRRIAPAIATLQGLLWSEAAATLMRQPGPECWAVLLGRCFLAPERFRAELRVAPELAALSRDAAAAVLALGPAWRPWEILSVQRRAHLDLAADPHAIAEMTATALSVPEADYTVCHVVIYATDFGRGAAAPELRSLAEPLLASGCAAFAEAPGLTDLGLEILLAYRYLTGRWHPAVAAWTNTKASAFTGELAEARRAGLGLPQFYRVYHPALLAARIALDPELPAGRGDDGGDHDQCQ